MASSNVFLTLTSGIKTLVSSISAFTGNANEIISTNASGVINPDLLPPGVAGAQVTALSDGALTAGMFVNLYDNSGSLDARPADDAAGIFANGFVLDSVADDTSVTVYLQGTNTAVAGLVPGDEYFIATAGGLDQTPNVVNGAVIQIVGPALSATSIYF